MNYSETLDYIYGINRFTTNRSGMRNGFKNAKELLERMGNPQEKFKSIHIAGTNGKGSVASMLTHILYSNGYSVGMFTSPHLVDFTERIQVDLKQIDEAEVIRIVPMVRRHIEEMVADGHDHPRWFEIITAIGFQYFAERGVDYAVVEVGLGGRKDATNILNPQLSIITSISYDHISILGEDIGSIAFEKAGIIKSKTPIVVYPQTDEVSHVIRQVAEGEDAPIYEVGENNTKVRSSQVGRQVFDFEFEDLKLEELIIHLSGRHQVLNASTAILGIYALRNLGVRISKEAIRDGLAAAKWAGRLEVLRKDPDILVDGAHNVASARILAEAIEDYYRDRHLVLAIGMLRDKEVDKILEILCPLADTVIITHPDSDRAIDVEELSERSRPYSRDVITIDTVQEAIAESIELAGSNGVIIFSGSLYLVGEVRKLIKHECFS